jgi:hypothetical protein
MKISLYSLIILFISFFNSVLAFAEDKLVYTYGKNQLYEISSKKFVIADSSGNRSKIAFSGKSPYSFSNLDKEAVQYGLSYYGKLVANCGSYYFKYDGSYGDARYNDLNIVQGTNMVWLVAISPLSEADRLNGIEWRGQIAVGLVGSLRRYYLRNSAWTTWKTDNYIDDYMGHTQKVNGKWEYGQSRTNGQNRPITCSDLPAEAQPEAKQPQDFSDGKHTNGSTINQSNTAQIDTPNNKKTTQTGTPQFADHSIDQIYTGKNHPLIMDSFGKEYRTRLRNAIAYEKPSFAGHYIVTRWSCGTGGCNTGAIIDAITGQAYPFPVAISSVYPLKPEFENENGQEHIYKMNSRLMIFAGNIYGSAQGDGNDTVEFYEFKDGKFIFIKSIPYGKQDKTQ